MTGESKEALFIENVERGESAEWEQNKADLQRIIAAVFIVPPLFGTNERSTDSSTKIEALDPKRIAKDWRARCLMTVGH